MPSEMRIGVKQTKAVEQAFGPELIQQLTERSVNACLQNPPAPGKGASFHYETPTGELVAYVFYHNDKWRCYFAFANESPIPEEFPQ